MIRISRNCHFHSRMTASVRGTTTSEPIAIHGAQAAQSRRSSSARTLSRRARGHVGRGLACCELRPAARQEELVARSSATASKGGGDSRSCVSAEQHMHRSETRIQIRSGSTGLGLLSGIATMRLRGNIPTCRNDRTFCAASAEPTMGTVSLRKVGVFTDRDMQEQPEVTDCHVYHRIEAWSNAVYCAGHGAVRFHHCRRRSRLVRACAALPGTRSRCTLWCFKLT